MGQQLYRRGPIRTWVRQAQHPVSPPPLHPWHTPGTAEDLTAGCGRRHTYEKAFQLFHKELGLSDEERSWIMGECAARLFRWQPPPPLSDGGPRL